MTWALRQLHRPIVWQFLVVIAADLAINAQLLLEFHGYMGFINFDIPYSTAQVPGFPGAWSPYQYNGVPELNLVLSQVGYLTNTGPIGVLYSLLGPTNGAKFYIVGSIAFLGLTSLLFLRSVVHSPWGQIVGALFLVVGPFQLQLYDQGDYTEFVLVGCILLSVFLLDRAFRRPRDAWVFFPLSLWVLFLGGSEAQFLILGLFLWLFFLLLFVVRDSSGRTWLRRLGLPLARVIAVPLVLAPLLLTAFYGPLNLGPSSPLAQSLSQFSIQTTDPLSVFLLRGYVGSIDGTLIRTVSPFLENLWFDLSLALLIGIWLSYFLTWDRRVLAVLGLAVLASLFGSGPHGPLGGFNQYVYTHVPGAQSLNTSYYWDWILIAPAYAVALASLVERLGVPPRPVPDLPIRVASIPPLRRAYRLLGRLTQWRGRWLYALALAVVLLAAAVIPYGTGALYSPEGGIRETNFPSDYTQIVPLIQQLVGNSYSGVAILNPDVNWFFNNATEVTKNPFFLYPVARTPGLPVYTAPPVASNYYFYWLFSEFYTNATPYVGELFALAGVQYLIVLNGTQSASFYPHFLPFSYGVNPNVLLRYQVGIVPIDTSPNFVVYRNLFYGGVASALTSLSVVAGDYDELASIAAAGVNLTNTAAVFPTDLTPSTCAQEMPYIAHVYAQSPNALLGYALQCNYLSASDPVSQLTLSTQGWISSQGYVGSPVTDRWPAPLAVALGGPWTLTIPVSTAGCTGSCSLWVPVRFNGDGGSLTFSWGSQTFTLNTAGEYEGYSSSMVWVGLPFSIAGSSGPLHVTAVSGDNAIGSILVESTSPSNTSVLTDWLSTHLTGTTLVQATPVSEVEAEPGGNYGTVNMTLVNAAGVDRVSLPVTGLLRSVAVELRFRANDSAALELSLGSAREEVRLLPPNEATDPSGFATASIDLGTVTAPFGSDLVVTDLNGSFGLSQISVLSPSLVPLGDGASPTATISPVAPTQTLSDVNPSISVSVVGGSSGYEVTLSASASLVLSRVAYFTDLESSQSAVSLLPALGSVAALIWNPNGHTTIAVGLGVTELGEIGWVISGVTTAVWIVVEYVFARRGAVRRGERSDRNRA